MEKLSRASLAHLPTPVEALPRLSRVLGGPQLWVKRDDQTGLALGGNKTRKLEYLAGDALQQGAETLITAGADQSNHCRQTAAAAARLGLKCILVLNRPEAYALPGVEHEQPSGNLALDMLLGAELVWTDLAARGQTLAATFQAAQEAGRKPYLIPYGGSNPVGAAGYVEAAREALAQGVNADWFVFASSSGGTQAGLVVGARQYGFRGRVLGISIDEKAADLRAHVAELANKTSHFLELEARFTPDAIEVNDEYLGGGYGVYGAAEREAMELFARHEGLLLDPVYTARAAAGLIGLIRQGFFQPHERVLFWHTGGAPALFADRYSIG